MTSAATYAVPAELCSYAWDYALYILDTDISILHILSTIHVQGGPN